MKQTDTDTGDTPDSRPSAAGIAIIDWHDDTPFSPRYDDRYHTLSGARAQSEHVFLGGCELPAAWAGRRDWCILETGFGLGLNFLATWACWLGHPERPRQLRFVSTEAHPVSAADIRQATAHDAVLAPLGEQLASAWPGIDRLQTAPSLHLVFSGPDGPPGNDASERSGIALHVLLGDAATRLAAWRRQHGPVGADSVFLDGFDPRKNPAMWSAHALQQVAAHCRPGARMATWCVARSVRDAATEAGFSLSRRPGLPPKRHCLAGRLDERMS